MWRTNYDHVGGMHDWKGGCTAGEGGAPITACQPLPPASLGFPPESFQEPHCFVSLTQDLGFCYTPAKLWGFYLQQRDKWGEPACDKDQCDA